MSSEESDGAIMDEVADLFDVVMKTVELFDPALADAFPIEVLVLEDENFQYDMMVPLRDRLEQPLEESGIDFADNTNRLVRYLDPMDGHVDRGVLSLGVMIALTCEYMDRVDSGNKAWTEVFHTGSPTPRGVMERFIDKWNEFDEGALLTWQRSLSFLVVCSLNLMKIYDGPDFISPEKPVFAELGGGTWDVVYKGVDLKSTEVLLALQPFDMVLWPWSVEAWLRAYRWMTEYLPEAVEGLDQTYEDYLAQQEAFNQAVEQLKAQGEQKVPIH